MTHIAIHNTLLFGLVYNAAPCSNILGSIYVCVSNIATIFTLKSFRISFTNMQAIRTHLRCVGWRNYNQPNSTFFGFVCQKSSKLVKSPSVKFCFLILALWFCSIANIRQILNSYALFFGFCFFYNLLCYGMVRNGNKPSFSATKPFQQLSTASCAFSLNAGSYFRIFFANFFNGFRIITYSVRKRCYVCLTKIDPYKFFNIINIFIGYINCLKKIKLTIFINQIRFSLDKRDIIGIVAYKWDFKPSTNRPYRHNVIRLECQNPIIVRDSPKLIKYPSCFSIQLVSVGNLAYNTNNHLATKIKCGFNFIVTFFVKSKLLKTLFIPSNIRNSIASRIRFLYCFYEQISLLIIWQYFYLKCKFHNVNIGILFFKYKKIN